MFIQSQIKGQNTKEWGWIWGQTTTTLTVVEIIEAEQGMNFTLTVEPDLHTVTVHLTKARRCGILAFVTKMSFYISFLSH